ncbi:hypothetical protein GCM10009639_11000 [Kitasatospora putterlickiae]|uniref:DUF7144 domain-containing protein n=1 Tax=Kitasatospora putterlickiae TaxID=221725 RepID=A0ABN1XPZ9_9ACTN
MTAAVPHGAAPPAGASATDDPVGSGLLTFAGVLLVLVGALNALDGISAIAGSHVFIGDAHFVFGDLLAWGWVMLVLAVAQLGAAYGVLALRAQWARWAGVVVLVLNAFAQMSFVPSYPVWSLTIIAIDVVAIYALTAYATPGRWGPARSEQPPAPGGDT